MTSPFENIPQDADTVAAVRKLCDERAYPAACAQKLCRRTRRCRGRWVTDPTPDAFCLPLCLMAALDDLHGRLGDAKDDLYQLERAFSAIRQRPDPEDAAESRPDDAGEPVAIADYARWTG